MSVLSRDPSCPFCQIAGGDGTAEVVCDGESWLAFFPHDPATPGHTLVIPKSHVTDLWAVQDPRLAAELMEAVMKVGRAVHRALKPEGMNLISSAGSTAEQTVFHLHLHVVPRWHADNFGQIWPRTERYLNRTVGDVAARIREACSADD
jgi:histidine triad (HIT) family protein